MKTIIALLSMWAMIANATTIETYATRLDIAADGSAKVGLTVQLADVEPGRLVLPTAFTSIDNFQVVAAPLGVRVSPVQAGERVQLVLEADKEVPPSMNVQLGFSVAGVISVPTVRQGKKPDLPEGSALLTHAFVNTQPLPIGVYRLNVMLPEGQRVQLIREQLPKPKRSDVVPRVRLDADDGRQGAQLQISELKQGDRTSMVLEIVDEKRSIGWLVVGLLLAIGYLLGFSDLVRPKKSSPATT